MIVTEENFDSVVQTLSQFGRLGFDSETTGLRIWHDDKIFSAIFATSELYWYFNFQDYSDPSYRTMLDDWLKEPENKSVDVGEKFDKKYVLPREYLKKLQPLFDDPNRILYEHNAKFDTGMLDKEGIETKTIIHCTQAIARVERNDHMTYDLGDCAARIGESKDDIVDHFIMENKLWKWQAQPGKKIRKKNKFFYMVPFELIVPYGGRDAMVALRLGLHQEKAIEEISNQNNKAIRKLNQVMHMERKLTQTCYTMEKMGVPIDQEYSRKAIEFEEARYGQAAKKFEELTGIEFVDSNKVLANAFTRAGEIFPTTDKGNPSFTDEILSGFSSPIAKTVQDYRDSYKRCNTYFRSFLYFVDPWGFIHPNIKQGGASTGRVSYAEPNFQNLTKDEDASLPFPVRRAVIPKPDHLLMSIDYDQQEFRLMLDYAEQFDLIQRIMEGFDPHQSTAELVGIGRRPAKILNFGLLYGMGIKLLARKLECSEAEARAFKEKYFSALDKVKIFIKNATRTAERRGFVFTWSGRRLHFVNPDFAYKAANGIIQGGCGDICKEAMNRIYDFLKPYKTKMSIQVHDELLFMLHKEETFLIEPLKKIMEGVYPYKHIPLTCSVSHSYKSWGDMIEGEPTDGQKARDEVQGECDRSISQGAS